MSGSTGPDLTPSASRRCTRALAAAALLLCGACFCKRAPLPPGALLEPARLRAALAERRQGTRSVRGEARLELFTEEGYAPHSQVIVAERPGRLHMEALSPFDMPVAVLTSDGDRFQLYSLQEGVFYHGPATPENLARIIPLPLSPTDLVEVLLGGAPLLPDAGRVRWDGRTGQYVFTLTDASGHVQELRLAPDTLDVLSSRVETPGGKLLYSLQFEDHEFSDGVRLPRRLRFEMPSREVEVELRWKDVEVNARIPPEAYTQEPPRGVRQERLP